MSNRPRREIKAKNVFEEDESTTPNPFTIQVTSPQPIQPSRQVTIPQPPQPVRPPPLSTPKQPTTNANNNIQKTTVQNVKVEPAEQDKKKSKIEELKSKYLKKPTDSKPTQPATQTNFQPITLKYTVSVDSKTEMATEKIVNQMTEPTIVTSKSMYENPYEPTTSPHHNFTEPPSPNPFEGLFSRHVPTSILETKASGRHPIDCQPLLLCTEVSSPTPVPPKTIVRPPPPPAGPVKVSRRNIGIHGHNDQIKQKSEVSSPEQEHHPVTDQKVSQQPLQQNDRSAYSPATNPITRQSPPNNPITRQSPPNRVINLVHQPHSPQPQTEQSYHPNAVVSKQSARIKHTVSINRSLSPEPTDTTDIQPIPISNIQQNVNELDLLNNVHKLVDDIRNSHMIDQHVYEQILRVLAGNTHPIYANDRISFVLDNPNFQFSQQQSSYQWLLSFFDNFALVTSSIDPQCYALTYHFITSAFNTTGILCQAFFLSLVKLDHSYYNKHLDELLKNIGHYLYVLRKHRNSINFEKLNHFVKFILGNLSRQYTFDNYCRIFIDIAYEYPEIVLAEQDAITEFFRQNQRFGYVALFFMLIKSYPVNTQIKSLASCINSIVRYFEEKGYKQEILTILDGCSIFGQNAYRLLREIRGRVVQKMDSQEGKKDGLTSVFGGLLNKTFDFINSSTGKGEKSEPVKAQEPEEKEDIKWDPIKKRYVLKGEIPQDEEEAEKETSVPLPAVPPPPPSRQIQNSDRPSVSVVPTQDRPVGVVPPPKKGRLPPNRYVQ